MTDIIRRNYGKAPLVEAVADFRFKETEPWDWTVPGLLYELIRDEFPIKKQESTPGFQIIFGKKRSPDKQAMNVSRVQFLRKDESALVQIGPHTISIHHLLPYVGWPTFREMIARCVDNYLRVSEDQELSRVGLRYINKIDIGNDPIDLEDYFAIAPDVPSGVPRLLNRFLVRLEIPYTESPQGMLKLAFGSHEEDTSILILDLGLISAGEDVPNMQGLETWLDTSHDRIEEAFESSITDETRATLFEEVT